MNYCEATILRNRDIAKCTYEHCRENYEEQLSLVRDRRAEIDRSEDAGQDTAILKGKLGQDLTSLSRWQKCYNRAAYDLIIWEKRATLFQDFRTAYHAAGERQDSNV